jgi:diaminopimelate epimerase
MGRRRLAVRFTKMHGAGNDYIYIDARDQERDWPALSVAMSDRHLGVGSDGIILALPSDRAHLRMRMFNADGSEGEMCGNALRCLVAFSLKLGIVPSGKSHVVVETLAGERWVEPQWEGGRVTRALEGMGKPSMAVEDIPVEAPGHTTLMDYPLRIDGHGFEISCVSMGNPHAVAFIDKPVDEVPLHQVGPMVENHPMFPQRVNFEIANVVDGGRVNARVWERGSGLTMASGTGACAIAVIGRLRGLTGSEVTVSMPGGDLVVRWPGLGDVVLEGPVQEVFEGEWPD